MRGVRKDRLHLGSPPNVHDLRQDRLLRLIAEPSRDRACGPERPPDHSLGRARRGLELVLHRRSRLRVLTAVSRGSSRCLPTRRFRLSCSSLCLDVDDRPQSASSRKTCTSAANWLWCCKRKPCAESG